MRTRGLHPHGGLSVYRDDFNVVTAETNRDVTQNSVAGFREQTVGWPQQPIEIARKWLAARPASWTVADLGCGDASLGARSKQRVLGFDLVAGAPGVTACDLADLPLSNSSLDAAVFCLSLMGTNYGTFMTEAIRALKPGGELWIAEVQSR